MHVNSSFIDYLSVSPEDLTASAREVDRTSRRVLLIIAALVIFRWIYLQVIPLELAADEAYYWDWSRQLDWGYYSKPPMIAWIAAVSTRLGGLSEAVLRTPAIVCGALALWGVYALATSLYGVRVGWWAFLTAASTPGNAAMSLFMTIDAPFLCAWVFAVWCVWELFRTEQPAARWLPLAILTTGIGLLSKQTMLSLMPLTAAWLATRRDAAHSVPWRRFAIWTISSLMFCVPAVIWNLSNGWLTVQHTREHFQWRSMSWFNHLSYYVEFAAGQAGIVSPLTYLLLTAVSLVALVEWRRLHDRERFLLSLGLIPLLAITALSFFQRVQPNWPVAFHLTGMILLAAWAQNAWSTRGLSSRWRPLFPVGLMVGVGFLILFYATPVGLPHTPWVGGRFDPLSRLRGWKQLAGDVDQLRRTTPLDPDPLLITMTGRGIVSELAFYLPDHPRVFHWNIEGTIASQHDVWGGPVDIQGQNALVLVAAGEPVPAAFSAECSSITFLKTLRQNRGGSRHDDYDAWLARGLRHWPASRSPENSHDIPSSRSRTSPEIANQPNSEGPRR